MDDAAPAANPDAISVCPGLALAAGEGSCKELAVPVIEHQKDTKMLTLEAPNEEPPMGWDKPDFASYPYCARAGVAMVNAYYHAKLHVPGKLSQDRIGYEVFRHLPGAGGPEYDLPVVGIDDGSTGRYSLPLALGTSGEYQLRPYNALPGRSSYFNRRGCYDYTAQQVLRACARSGWEPRSEECVQYRIAHESEVDCPGEIAYAWGIESLLAIRREIDEGHPVIATGPGHLFLWVSDTHSKGISSTSCIRTHEAAGWLSSMPQLSSTMWRATGPALLR